MIVLLSTSDTDLLSARASGAGYRLANPARLAVEDLPSLLEGATAVVVRLLGGRQAWPDGLDAIAASGVPMIVLGGEATPDAELMALSTVAGGVVAEAHAYLAHGGPENLRQLARFLSDAITLTGVGFEPPAATPTWGILERQGQEPQGRRRPGRRHPVLPRPSRGGKHRLRARPRRRRRGGRGTPAPGVLLLAAHGRTRADRRPARRGRDRRHRARRRRSGARHRGRRRRRRELGRRRAGQPGRPDPAGPVPDLVAGPVGRKRPGADPAGRRHPGRDPRVRRPADHGALLVQGSGARRPDQLRHRSGAHRAGGRDRREARQAAARPSQAAAHRDHALGLPDQARPHRQRGRAGQPRVGRAGCSPRWRRPATTSAEAKAETNSPAWPPGTATP